MEDASLRGTTTSSVPETAGQSTATAEAEPRATDEGIFLSNLLREIMPLISQSGGAEPSAIPPGEAQNSGNQRPRDSSTHVCSIFSYLSIDTYLMSLTILDFLLHPIK
jgi:hypothetical protein